MKFYKCDVCGKIIVMVNETDVPTVCCGQAMHEIVPGETDGAMEKHVPVVAVDGKEVTVKVGEVAHPMLEKHYIQWVIVETDKGFSKKDFKPGDEPVAHFTLSEGEKYVAAYELCNLHGLWKA